MRKTVKELYPFNDGNEINEFLRTASIEEIHDFILNGPPRNSPYQELARRTLDIRLVESAKKPHWTTTPGFWVAVAAMLFAGTATFLTALTLWPGLRGIFHLP